MKNDKLSIRARMTLHYSLAAFLVLTALSLLLYWETMNILYKADYQFLADQVETMQYLLANKSVNTAFLNQEIVEEGGKTSSSIYRYYTRVFTPDQKIMLQTPGMDTYIPVKDFVNKQTVKLVKSQFHWYTTPHKSYLIISAPVLIGKEKPAIVQIALDISYQHSMMSDRKILYVVLALSTLCSLLIGFLIAQRSMRSLYQLTETVTNITATSLHQRVEPSSLPKELAPLGQAFNLMLDRLESSFSRLKQFSADLAHELRTPIHTLRNQTEITLAHPHGLEEYQRVMVSNLEELERISHFIENILFLARAENPQTALNTQSINAAEEIANVCEFYQAVAEDKNIRVVCEGEANFPANQIMFRRLISNLLSNALNYTLDHGQVLIHMSTLNPTTAQIVIRDNGIGIARHHLPKLFDRFYRVDSSRTSQSGGTGLGLPIVKSIMDLHNGHLHLDSAVGLGTVITLHFPLAS